MPESIFQVRLSINKSARRTELAFPDILHDVEFHCLIVKEEGGEALIKVNASTEVVKKIEKHKDCMKLTPKQMEQLRDSYPAPRLKKKYRLRTMPENQVGSDTTIDIYELDAQGKKIIDTFQTVRSGFYLFDVPISSGDD
jgi:hypothetical protein